MTGDRASTSEGEVVALKMLITEWKNKPDSRCSSLGAFNSEKSVVQDAGHHTSAARLLPDQNSMEIVVSMNNKLAVLLNGLDEIEEMCKNATLLTGHTTCQEILTKVGQMRQDVAIC